MFSVVFVCHSVQKGGSHMTITYHTGNPPDPSPTFLRDIGPHCTGTLPLPPSPPTCSNLVQLGPHCTGTPSPRRVQTCSHPTGMPPCLLIFSEVQLVKVFIRFNWMNVVLCAIFLCCILFPPGNFYQRRNRNENEMLQSDVFHSCYDFQSRYLLHI